ncbi:CAP domain-containing protein [Caballeronia sp. LP003]|uniref:CAP domain-containing protein n=1 Tax=Caballeronia sp. LP003 TaxID=3038551 RepID=UPI00285AFDAD|nr:CAP domain-containing protein [Caballeronia sp. LP003]MDR5791735.1 CAP domain-containing protein [Caballeronia sp. LP003]
MKKHNGKAQVAMVAAAVAACAMLAACGGGGGGDNNSASQTGSTSPSTTPTSQTYAPLLTTTPSNTYAAGSAQARIAAMVNSYRQAMGVGQLKQDTALDTAATAHSLYLVTNLASGAISAATHDEASGYADYFEATPLSRARKAGVSVTEYVGESAGAGFAQDPNSVTCNGQFSTVYHLQGLTSNQETMGVGFQSNAQGYYGCVLDFGQTTGVAGTPSANGFYQGGGQQMDTTTVAHSPVANETNVARAMASEAPNPAPDVAAPGRPIMVRMNAASAGDVLTVSSFTLSSAAGTVPARIIVPSSAMTGSTGATADVNNALYAGVAFLLPLAKLEANTTYTVTFSGQRNGAPVSTSWSFTTGA